jgi:hypothetical protein
VILKGDVPSPVNPPPGCRFHTRCWLYERLGQPENCRTDDPMLQPVAGVEDHRAACHYADEALKTDVGIAHLDDTLVRRGTPPAALASLAASRAAAADDAVAAAAAEELEAPAFEDMSADTAAIEASDGLQMQDPTNQNTPSKRADRWRRGRFGR